MTTAWPEVALDAVATIERSAVAPDAIEPGTIYVGLENITSDGGFKNQAPVARGDLASQKFTFGPEHVLYGKLRPYLSKIAAPAFAGVCSTDILPIRPGPELDKRYLLHFLRQPAQVAKAASLATGANLPRLSPKVLAQVTVPLPPLEQQRRIAGILDAADEVRAKRHESLALLDSLTEAIFLDMFGDPITNPFSFKTRPLGEIASFVRGVTFKPADVLDGPESDAVACMRTKNVQEDLDISDVIWIPQHVVRREDQMLRDGDTLISSANSWNLVGRACWIEGLPWPSAFGGFVTVLRAEPGAIEPWYLNQWFRSRRVQALARSFGQKTTNISNLNLRRCEQLQVPIPPPDLQRRFLDRCLEVSEQRGLREHSAAEMDLLFASLQHRAFRGEL